MTRCEETSSGSLGIAAQTPKTVRRLLLSVSLWTLWPQPAVGEVAGTPRAVLDAWLRQQAQIGAWSAEVIQTRQLKSLVRPLESVGRVWFAPPNRFRWQLGEPPRTIAVRTGEELAIVYPKLRQIERYALGDDLSPAWRQALALLEVGLPSDPAVFYERYELLSGRRDDDAWHFELQPTAKASRRLIERIRLAIGGDTPELRSTELVFPDGSLLRNVFHELRIDTPPDDSLFELDDVEGFEIVRPVGEDR